MSAPTTALLQRRVTAGINDPRVSAWIPAKFAARLQAATASDKPVLLRVDYDAGHGGVDATMRQAVAAVADQFSFALWQSGDPAFQPNPNLPRRSRPQPH